MAYHIRADRAGGLALIDLLPEGTAGIRWMEMIHGVEVEKPEPRYVVPVG